VKIAIITDQHFGARKNSKLFHDYFLKFYEDIFFPTLIKEGITTIVDMGDTFDSRKGVDFVSLEWAKNHYYDRLEELGITVHTIIGNHTAYYKNTNDLTGVGLFLREYDNVKIYPEAEEVRIDKTKFLFVPWINPENQEKTFELIEESDSPCVMGHLELNGFMATRGHFMEHGMDSNIFDKFDKVYSGHYHMRSNKENIFYLGNPYEMYWNDCGDKRGFNILDTETGEIEFVENTYHIFEKIYYEDTPAELFKAHLYKDKIVKLFIRSRKSQLQYDKFLDKLMKAGIIDLKVVENTAINDTEVDLDSERIEDTLTLLNKYIQDSDFDLEKERVKTLLKEVYLEACEAE